MVLIAPMRRATASTSSTASNSATLSGIVTLAPLMPMRAAERAKSSALDRRQRQVDRVDAARARNAALCIAGDTECAHRAAGDAVDRASPRLSERKR